MKKKTKVLIIDDSAIARRILSGSLAEARDIEIVGTAPDAYVARDKIVQLSPDVITLDIEMPRMDGITFLRKLMESYPLPVIVVSSVTEKGCAVSMEALELRAVDVIEKPDLQAKGAIQEFSIRLIDTVRAATQVKFRPRVKRTTAIAVPPPKLGKATYTKNVIAIGASTGGTEAIKRFLQHMPTNAPGIVIVQHMPPHFTKAFAERLDSICELEVLEAEDGMKVTPGTALISPGSHHMLLTKSSPGYRIQLKGGPLVCRHRPSVEVLFNSVAKNAGDKAIGIIMTGMGRDGAEGLRNMREAGARTIAQDEESSVVFGMPKEAIKIDAAEKIVSLDKIPQTVFSMM